MATHEANDYDDELRLWQQHQLAQDTPIPASPPAPAPTAPTQQQQQQQQPVYETPDWEIPTNYPSPQKRSFRNSLQLLNNAMTAVMPTYRDPDPDDDDDADAAERGEAATKAAKTTTTTAAPAAPATTAPPEEGGPSSSSNLPDTTGTSTAATTTTITTTKERRGRPAQYSGLDRVFPPHKKYLGGRLEQRSFVLLCIVLPLAVLLLLGVALGVGLGVGLTR